MLTPEALRDRVRAIRETDPALEEEISKSLAGGEQPEWLPEARAGLAALRRRARPLRSVLDEPVPPELVEETIVLRMGRPVVTILDGRVRLELGDTGSETWRARLEASSAVLTPAIAAVGRVEVSNHPSGLAYMGTGWLIDRGVVATNRHVALAFAARGTGEFTFLTGFDRKSPIGVDIDFLEEYGSPRQAPVRVVEVLFIAKDHEPDIAFLRLDPAAKPAATVIGLADGLPPDGSMVAVIGYPARDTRVPDALLMDRIFGKVYDKKRLAPGLTTGYQRASMCHDCTTLGGNSGSPLIDLATGHAAGMHYSGAFLEANYAVPAPTLRQVLADVRRSGGVHTTQRSGEPMTPKAEIPVQQTELKLTFPLEITIRVGDLATASSAGPAVAVGSGKPRGQPREDEVEAAVAEARRLYGQRPDVYAIEAGWEFTDGWITGRRAVVFAVRSKLAAAELAAHGVVSLPAAVNGVPVDVRVARLDEVSPEFTIEAAGAGWTSTYERLADEASLLADVNTTMTVTLHASPDAGWSVLKPFLAATTKRMTVGMYDFTAPHIVAGVLDAARPRGRRLALVLQPGESLSTGTKKDDLPEEEWIADFDSKLRNRFTHATAVTVGPRSPFKSAYHIKVAVRDGSAFWLSSGNWQSSNQPELDPIGAADHSPPLLSSHNREWHIVVEDEQLAAAFETYLGHDFDQATAAAAEAVVAAPPMVWVPAGYFQPSEAELEGRVQYSAPLSVTKKLRVQPLLTPDNYAGHVADLIRSATQHVYFQNQSLRVLEHNPPHFEELLNALLVQQQAGLDVRMIIRSIGDIRDTVSRIRNYGFDTDGLRLQTNCHNKGIVVDGTAVLLGSHNWTGDGTGFNRDASLIIHDSEVADYYEQLFLYDWNRIGPPRIDESLPAPELADPTDRTLRPGMVLVPLTRWLGDT